MAGEKPEAVPQAESGKGNLGENGISKQDGSLKRIEQLLEQQAEHDKKMLRSSRIRTCVIFVLVVAVIVLGIAMYQRVDAVADSAQQFMEVAESDLTAVFQSLSEIDFRAMNDTIEGIGSIDFDAINASIEGLAAGVEAFQRFAQALTNPFGL